MSQYVTEVQVHETSSVTIPNLQVTAVPMPPESGLQSGSAYTYSFTVTNVGSADRLFRIVLGLGLLAGFFFTNGSEDPWKWVT